MIRRTTVLHHVGTSLVSAWLLACSSDAPRAGARVTIGPGAVETKDEDKDKPSGPTIFDVQAEAPGSNCAAGGEALRSGRDANHDGVLEDSEVTRVDYICNGVDGKTPLLSTTPEPVGLHCPTGGHAIAWGYDTNANGTLDASEVKSTAYVCNGLPGAAGQDGKNSLATVLDLAPGDTRCGAAGGKGIYTGVDTNRDGLLQPGEVQGSSILCNGAAGLSSLVRQSPEPAGASCADGGTRIDSGLDADGDGTLSDSEIAKTSYVCNGAQGASGLNSLLATTPEPAGPNCADGGERIDVGLDRNTNGTLDVSEITATTYACNGGPGANGAAGLASLVSQKPEPAGANCAAGGTRLDTGLDADGDGVLEASEIARTTYVCNGATAPSGGTPRFRAIDVANDFECAVMTDGTARCWGSNNNGELGDGTTTAHTLPTEVPGLAGVVAISTGGRDLTTGHACALLLDSTVRCWGANGSGQLGVGTEGAPNPSPTTVRAPSSWSYSPYWGTAFNGVAAISAGGAHTCALRTDGTTWCWGDDGDGQLGDGDGTTSPVLFDRTRPVRTSASVSNTAFPPLDTAIGMLSLSAGGAQTCGLKAGGDALCWGKGFVTYPTSMSGLRRWGGGTFLSVSAGDAHQCGVRDGGTVICTGVGTSGQLGGSFVSLDLKLDGGQDVQLADGSTLTDIAVVDAGMEGTCAMTALGGAACWGKIGLQATSRATAVAGLPLVASLSTGTKACAVTLDGSARCWGATSRMEVLEP